MLLSLSLVQLPLMLVIFILLMGVSIWIATRQLIKEHSRAYAGAFSPSQKKDLNQ